jgi:hypothetical protein
MVRTFAADESLGAAHVGRCRGERFDVESVAGDRLRGRVERGSASGRDPPKDAEGGPVEREAEDREKQQRGWSQAVQHGLPSR